MYIKFFRPCKLEKVYYYNYNERNCFNFNEELWSPTCISPNNLIKYLGGGGEEGGELHSVSSLFRCNKDLEYYM